VQQCTLVSVCCLRCHQFRRSTQLNKFN
jgi:hypothetical protein